MPDTERYEILILGSGESGKHLAWTMAQAGHRHSGRRAEIHRRLLPQYRLPAE